MSDSPKSLAEELIHTSLWEEYLEPKLRRLYLEAISVADSPAPAEVQHERRGHRALLEALYAEITAEGGAPHVLRPAVEARAVTKKTS